MNDKNPSPKTRFQQNSALLRDHRNVMQVDQLQKSFDYASLEMQRRLAQSGLNPAEAFQRLVGASMFIDILLNLGEEQPKHRPVDRDNLPTEKT